MAKELAHITKGTQLTQAEFEHIDLHAIAGQEQGDIIYASSATQLSGLVHGNAGEFLQTGGDSANPSWAAISRKNAIINGSFRVAQRGTSFTAATVPLNSDDTFLLDRWILLSEGNDIVDVTQNSSEWIKLEVETANKQFGILTILEAKDCLRLVGETVSLSFQAKMAAADDNTHSLKAVVLSWSSTADTVTSDVVDAWGATPTYVANWTAENTPSSNTLTTSVQTFKIEGISVDTASTTNIAVFIFCDQTDGVVDDAVFIRRVQLELGSVATPFEFRPYGQELTLCQRYYVKQYSDLGVIGQVATVTASITGSVLFPVHMRTTPTIVILGPSDAASHVRRVDNGGDITITTPIIGQLNQIGYSYIWDAGGTPFTAGLGYHYNLTASIEL
uniref:Uncharacterized protein n=1 Tax=viral metagenome TaxID=1070528 RepID=A0A6M3ILR5_9ZZZZ